MKLNFPLILSLVLITGSLSFATEQIVYFGTGGRAESKGIYMARLDVETGKLSAPELAAEALSPGFLAIHPDEQLLYSVCAVAGVDRRKSGGVSAFAIKRPSGKLKFLNQVFSGGAGPCHLTVDQTGKTVLVANYGSGTVAALEIADDGRVSLTNAPILNEGSSVDPKRQTGPHAHSINVDPANKFAVVADLGLDKVLVFKLDPDKAMLAPHSAVSVAPGSGPRHFAFHPGGKFAYVINELLSTITAFSYDGEAGNLKELQTLSTLPDGHEENNSTAEVQVHPSGKFVYGSNRGHDTIAVFACDPDEGTLTLVEHEPIRGEVPRNFGIDPTGTFLLAAGQKSNSVAVFRIDQETGALDYAGSEIEVPNPICVKFLPVGE